MIKELSLIKDGHIIWIIFVKDLPNKNQVVTDNNPLKVSLNFD